MSGASSTLDPVKAARADIAQSRDLIASVEDDLHRNQRWFDSYRISEKRHARRLKRLELFYWLQLRWEQFARVSERTALSAARDARDAYRFLRRNASAAAAWAAPRLHAVGLRLGLQGRRLGLAGYRAAKDASAWTVRNAPIVGRRIAAATSASLAWSYARLREFSQWLAAVLSFSAKWFRVEFDAAALATGNAASVASTWSARKGRRGAVHAVKLSRRTKVMAADMTQTVRQSSAEFVERAAIHADALRERWNIWSPSARTTSRALVVRQSTALVCVEPARSNLPAAQTPPQARETPKPRPKAARKKTAKPKAARKAKPKTKTKSNARAKRKSAPRRGSSKT